MLAEKLNLYKIKKEFSAIEGIVVLDYFKTNEIEYQTTTFIEKILLIDSVPDETLISSKKDKIIDFTLNKINIKKTDVIYWLHETYWIKMEIVDYENLLNHFFYNTNLSISIIFINVRLNLICAFFEEEYNIDYFESTL